MSDIVPISFNGQGLFPVSSGKARTKGQQALIEYLVKCMEQGVNPDKDWMVINVYKKHLGIKYNWNWMVDKLYATTEECKAAHPEYKSALRWCTRQGDDRPKHWACSYEQEEVSDWVYGHKFGLWYTNNLGSLLKQGLLFAIPTGYILKKIDATIEISE